MPIPTGNSTSHRVNRTTGFHTKVGTSVVEVLEIDSNRDVLLARGTTVPTDGDAGFAKGCEFIDTDASAGSIRYVNEGTNTAADFNPAAVSGPGPLLVGGALVATTDTRTGSGAISTTTLVTKINTTGGGALTLADGVDGQIKILVLDVDSGTDAVITPATKTGYTTITMGDAGDGVSLVFVTTRGWIVFSNNGSALA